MPRAPNPALSPRGGRGGQAAISPRLFSTVLKAMKSLSPRLASAYLRRRGEARARGRDFATRRAARLRSPIASRPSRPAAFGPSGSAASPASGRGRAWTPLYLHGGAFFAGSPLHYRPITAAFAFLDLASSRPPIGLPWRHPFPGGAGRRAGGLCGAGRARRNGDRRKIRRRRPRSVADDFAPRRRPAASRCRRFVFALDRSFRHWRLGARQ